MYTQQQPQQPPQQTTATTFTTATTKITTTSEKATTVTAAATVKRIVRLFKVIALKLKGAREISVVMWFELGFTQEKRSMKHISRGALT